jgi:hypothetical protein
MLADASDDDMLAREKDDEEDEVGNEVLLEPTGQGMTLLRLLIHIRTAISNLWASRSKTLAKACKWTNLCMALVNAITKSCNAMSLWTVELCVPSNMNRRVLAVALSNRAEPLSSMRTLCTWASSQWFG